MMEKKYAIGVDIGGSHISAVLVDIELGMLVPGLVSTRHVNKHGSADEILNDWKSVIQETMIHTDGGQLTGIGFAMPGPFDYENGISLLDAQVDKYESLYKMHVGNYLRTLLGLNASVPFRFMNDASAFAVGEAWIGKTAQVHKSIAITLGTGFGSAFIENGVPVINREDVPEHGNFWHIPYRKGIADDYFSTRWFVKSYAELTGISLPGTKEIAGKALTETPAKSLFEEFGSNLGLFLGPWIKKFGAECLVIGGNMTGAMDLFGPRFTEALQEQQININITISDLMETAAMAGSARLLDNRFWMKIQPLLSIM